MKILHLLASPVWSGPAENIALLAVEQRKLGHDVSIAIDRKRPGLRDEEPLRPRLEALQLLDESGLELSVKSAPWMWLSDVRTLKRQKLDVVHSHFTHDHFIARFGCPKSAVLVRSIHAERSLKSVPKADGYTGYADRNPLPKAPRRTLRALLAPEFEPAADKAALRIRLLNLHGAAVIATSSTADKQAKDAGATGANAANPGVMAGGAEVAQSAVSAEPPTDAGDVTGTLAAKRATDAAVAMNGALLIGMVSHLVPGRGHDLGLRAFAELRRIRRDAQLRIIGDGPLRTELEALARTLDVPVTFVGYQSGADFVEHLQALDVVWLLGLGNDFTARAARQARACDVRVVGVDEGALPEWSDVTVPRTAEAIAVATTDVKRRSVPSLTNEDIARDVLALYEEARR